MKLWDVPRLYRRAILIYVATIVAPACGLVWLGVQSFERQRQALATLTAEKLAAEMEAVLHTAAERALTLHSHPAAKYFFSIQHSPNSNCRSFVIVQFSKFCNPNFPIK